MNKLPKIAFGSLARDIESNFNNYYSFLSNLEKLVDIDLFIYENDSIDNSKKLIPQITNYYILEDNNIPKFPNIVSFKRASIFANYRNILKDFIFGTYDYKIVIFCDSDFSIYPDPNIILFNINRLLNNNKIGAITSNGLSYVCIKDKGFTLVYYDIWALAVNNKIFDHNIIYARDINQEIEVDSAFGGLAIYNGEYIKNLHYEAIYLDGYEGKPLNRPCSEHVNFNLDLRKQDLSILINPNQKLYL